MNHSPNFTHAQELFPKQHEHKFEALRETHSLLPPKVPKFYRQKVEEEFLALQNREGPLYKIVYPTQEKMSTTAPGEVNDYIDDRQYIPKGTRGHFLHKYSNRILFMPTSKCLGHCMYCFRQDLLEEQHEQRSKELDLDISDLQEYLIHHPEVNEIILSGGDPLMLTATELENTCSRLSASHVKHFRIHTRALIFDPKVLTRDKIEILKKYNFRFVLHAVHPYELCDEVLEVLSELRLAGIRLYNQFPLLRGVNDHLEVLIKHLSLLDEHHIQNLSIFLPEPVLYSATYRISFDRIKRLAQELHNQQPAWLSSTRICQDTSIGKVRLDQQINSKDSMQISFERDGKVIHLPDLPKELDVAGELY